MANLVSFLDTFKENQLFAIGEFKFVVGRTAFDLLQKKSVYRWKENERLIGKSALHYAGENNEEYSIRCALFPGYAGQSAMTAYEDLRRIAAKGQPQIIIDSAGNQHPSKWVITSVEADEGAIIVQKGNKDWGELIKKNKVYENMMPRKIDLRLTIKEYVD